MIFERTVAEIAGDYAVLVSERGTRTEVALALLPDGIREGTVLICETNFVRDNVFAIDFDEKTVRVARTLNLIAGDGQTNVLHLNTLDYSRWNEITKQDDWNDTYNEGFKKLKKLQPKNSSDYSRFQFDLVMANPPFAGDIKENTIISR